MVCVIGRTEMLAKVKIEQDPEYSFRHRIYQNGKEIERVAHVDLSIDPFEVPYVNIEIQGGIDFEGVADIQFDYSPHTVKEACKILREELLKRGDLYRAFSASIYSALKDMPEKTWIDEMPEIILNRIIGEEEEKE